MAGDVREVADEDGGVEDARGVRRDAAVELEAELRDALLGGAELVPGRLGLERLDLGAVRGIVAGGRGGARRGGGGRAAVARREGRRAGAGSTSRAVVVAPVADRAEGARTRR